MKVWILCGFVFAFSGTAVAKPAKEVSKVKGVSEEKLKQNQATYMEKADKEIQEWSTKLKELEEKSHERGAEAREQMDRNLKVIREHLDEAREKWNHLRGSGSGAWDSLKQSLDGTLMKLRHDYHRAASHFKKETQ